MKRLNLRNPKPFENLWENPEPARIRFYIISEGPSEESYFTGIKNNKGKWGIQNDIHLEVIPKAEGEENFSHPYQLVISALECMGRIDEQGNERPREEWEKYCKWDYDVDYDRVCVIFDRDYRHLDIKLDEIYEKCRKHHIFIGISNPNFELWLLMHFPNIEKYDRISLFKNCKNRYSGKFPSASKNKKYLETLVAIQSGGYTKGKKLKFERFSEGVFLAIEQEKQFEEDEELLRNHLGSNLGILLTQMQNPPINTSYRKETSP